MMKVADLERNVMAAILPIRFLGKHGRNYPDAGVHGAVGCQEWANGTAAIMRGYWFKSS